MLFICTTQWVSLQISLLLLQIFFYSAQSCCSFVSLAGRESTKFCLSFYIMGRKLGDSRVGAVHHLKNPRTTWENWKNGKFSFQEFRCVNLTSCIILTERLGKQLGLIMKRTEQSWSLKLFFSKIHKASIPFMCDLIVVH